MKVSLRILTFFLSTLLSTSLLAADYVFTGNGAWSDAANWQGGVLPPTNLPAGSTITISGTAVVGKSCGDMCNTDLASSKGTITIAVGGTLTLNHYTQFGNEGTINVLGTLINQTVLEGFASGTINVWGTLVNQYWFGNQGQVVINSGGVVRNEVVGITHPSGMGAGVLDNTYIQNGSLVLNNGGTLTNLPPAVLKLANVTNNGGTINNTSRMMGNAVITGSLTNSGTLAPGNSPGTYTITGDYTATPTAVHAFEVGGLAPGAFDVLNASGTLNLDGALNVTLINGFSQTSDHDVTLFTGTVQGRFATTSLPSDYYLVYNPASVVLRKMATSVKVTVDQPAPYCVGTPVKFSATVSGDAGSNGVYEWQVNGAAAGINAPELVVYDFAEGQNQVSVTYTATIGGQTVSETNLIVLPVYSTAAPTITASGATSFCAGGSAVLASSGAGPYQWYLNGATLEGATAQSYSASQGGNYTVTVSRNGCVSQPSPVTEVVVYANPTTPVVSVAGGTAVCAGSSTQLSVQPETGVSYQWQKDGTDISGATGTQYEAGTAGSYSVTATTAHGCTATSSATSITLTPRPATPTISASGNVLTSSAAEGNQWYLDGAAISGATGQTYTAQTSGQYTVQVTQNGCSATSAVFGFTLTGIVSPAAWNGVVTTYPNPVGRQLFIKSSGAQRRLLLQLVDAFGRKVYEGHLYGASGTIDMQGMGRGVYQLLVTDLQKEQTIVIGVVKAGR